MGRHIPPKYRLTSKLHYSNSCLDFVSDHGDIPAKVIGALSAENLVLLFPLQHMASCGEDWTVLPSYVQS
jgi:hypothetical protein